MIKEITFEEIMKHWNKLWSKYVDKGYKINKVNTTTQKNYCYRITESLNQDQKEILMKPTYIGYFIEGNIVGVESGYKTNIDYHRVRGLWVDEHHRYSGIATKLINWFETRCQQKYLWTLPRHSALEFYLKYGFKVTGLFEKTVYGQNYFVVKEMK